MSREPGTESTLRALWWDGPLPEAGDFLRTRAGSCYEVLDVREGTSRGTIRATIRVMRLERNAVAEGDPGVWAWEFAPR